MSSNATSDGRFTIAVSFELGTNLDIAQMQVQNRVAVAQPRVPADVRNIGISVTNDAGVLCGHALAGVRRRMLRLAPQPAE